MQKLVGLGGAFAGREAFLNDFQIIGRGASCHIVIDDPTVSRDQARITRKDGVCQITSTDAAAIMLVNGHQTQGAVLRNLDTITLGRTTLQFVDMSHTGLQQSGPNYPVGAQPTQAPQFQVGAPTPAMHMQPSPQIAQHHAQPVQQGSGAHVGPGSNFNAVNVQVKTDNTALWVLLAVIFACPLMCVGLMALALLPYTMMAVGAFLAIWGLVEHLRFRNMNWQTPMIVYVKLWGGVIIATLGLVWAIALMSGALPGASGASAYDQRAIHKGLSPYEVAYRIGPPDPNGTKRYGPSTPVVTYNEMLGVGDMSMIYPQSDLLSAIVIYDKESATWALLVNFSSPGRVSNIEKLF